MYNISSVIEIFNLCDTEVVINISSVKEIFNLCDTEVVICIILVLLKRYLIFVTQKLLYV